MNNLFTFKAGVLLFGLLICQIGLKAQTIDTAKKANSSKLVKSDTTLVVKAGATLVQRSDTTLVINADSSFIKKFNAAVAKQNAELAKKADDAALQKANTINSPKSDTSVVRIHQNTEGVMKTDSLNAKTSDASTAPISAPVTTTSAPAVVGAGTTVINGTATAAVATNTATPPATTNSTPATTTSTVAPPKADSASAANNNSTPAVPANTPVAKTDSSANTNGASNATNNPSAAKTDSALATAKVDTTIKKTDTTLAKKPDTTLAKKPDTSLVVKDTTNVEVKAQNVYLEVGGAGLAISANYDTRFKKERNGWGYRVGVGFFTSGGNTVETVPFQVNYLIGEHASMFEAGVGTTFLNSRGTNVGNSKFEFDKVTGFIGTASIGYRYQPEHKGFNFRIAFVPILYDEGIIPAGAVSVGYTFK
jgi:hypothetical protein